jgi:4'-phosphopantetheinyl transferase EntD
VLPPQVVVRERQGVASSPELFPSEWRLVERAVPSRRAEFATGRMLARQALGTLGAADQPVLAGAHREPLWPEGFVGSITHSRDWCAVAVAPEGAVDYLGIDVEGAAPIPANVARLVHSFEEADRAADQFVDLTSTVIFSAKESVFKAYFQATATKLAFDQIQTTFDDDGSFLAALHLPDTLPRFSSISGVWIISEGLVMTAACHLKSPGAL